MALLLGPLLEQTHRALEQVRLDHLAMFHQRVGAVELIAPTVSKSTPKLAEPLRCCSQRGASTAQAHRQRPDALNLRLLIHARPCLAYDTISGRTLGSQQSMWVATADLPQGSGHPFYERLNQILNAAGFDAFVE